MLQKNNNELKQIGSRRCWKRLKDSIIKDISIRTRQVNGIECESTKTNLSQFSNLLYDKVSILSVNER